jgi:hypothetical protein
MKANGSGGTVQGKPVLSQSGKLIVLMVLQAFAALVAGTAGEPMERKSQTNLGWQLLRNK